MQKGKAGGFGGCSEASRKAGELSEDVPVPLGKPESCRKMFRSLPESRSAVGRCSEASRKARELSEDVPEPPGKPENCRKMFRDPSNYQVMC
jgi:hypothetical protein